MSSRVRRMALGLATLTLLASLFTVIQGFVDPPEQALAACQVETGCYQPYTYYNGECCCYWKHWMLVTKRECWRVNLDCSVTYWTETLAYDCGNGAPCRCVQPPQ